MAAFQKFNAFAEYLAEGKINLESDTLKVMLTNTAPLAANSLKADITEIAAGNGYTAGGAQAVQSSSAQTSGTYKLVLADVVFTAAGGSIAGFRYAVLYDDTPSSPLKPLIGFFDYGSTVNLASGESITVDFDGTTGVLTLA